MPSLGLPTSTATEPSLPPAHTTSPSTLLKGHSGILSSLISLVLDLSTFVVCEGGRVGGREGGRDMGGREGGKEGVCAICV